VQLWKQLKIGTPVTPAPQKFTTVSFFYVLLFSS